MEPGTSTAKFVTYLKENWVVVVFAAIGAVLPHLVALHDILLHPAGTLLKELAEADSTQMTLHALFYGLGLLVAAFLGIIFCAALEETNLFKALALGMAAPSMVVIMQTENHNRALAQQLADLQRRGPVVATPGNTTPSTPSVAPPTPAGAWLPFFSSRAWAQSPELPAAAFGAVAVEIFADEGSEAFVVEFVRPDGSASAQAGFAARENRKLVSPPDAVRVRFRRGEFQAERALERRPGEVLACEVKVARGRQLGFSTAFGKDPTTFRINVNDKYYAIPPPDTKGWVYFGKWDGTSWDDLYWIPQDARLPEPGQKLYVLFPLKVRPAPQASPSSQTLRLMQFAEILEPPELLAGGMVWVHVRVIK